MADLTAGSTPPAPVTPVAALQKALAAEHAAVWLFGFLGARVQRSEDEALARLLTDAFEAHRAQRDDLTALVAARGADPVASEIDYDPGGPSETSEQLRVLARGIEERVTRTWGEVVSGTAGEDRRLAVATLQAGAVRQLGFGSAPTDLPGLG